MAAARTLIERDGWETLTMRRLAAETGTAATTLYHHVRDKEDLLLQLLEHYAAEIPRPELPTAPRERAIAAATVMHDALAEWPWIVEVLSGDNLVGESAFWMVEAIMSAAVDSGLSPVEALHFYRTIWYYTAGEIMIRANGVRRRAGGKPTYRDTVLLKQTHLPTIAAVAAQWPELSMQDTYQYGLRGLVNGLLDSHPQQNGSSQG